MGNVQKLPSPVPDSEEPEETGGGGPGHNSVSAQLKEVRRQLRELLEDLRANRITPSVGAVMIQAQNGILRALSEERKAQAEEQVEKRVKELEDKVRGYD